MTTPCRSGAPHLPRSLVLLTLLLSPLLLGSLPGCRVARPSDLDRESDWIVAVKTCRLPRSMPWYTQRAEHTWIDVKRGDEESWQRFEVLGRLFGPRRQPIASGDAREDRRWRRDVELLAAFRDERARAIAERLEAASTELVYQYRAGYDAWPGPNSNTFVMQLVRRVDGLSAPLHHNAVGKDYPGWIDAGWTTSKTGVRIDTVPLGLAIGLREGLELHLLQLTFGVSLWPPRIKLPFLPALPPPASPAPPLAPPEDTHSVPAAASSAPAAASSTAETPHPGVIRSRVREP